MLSALRRLWCRVRGHAYVKLGTVTVRGFRPAALVVCMRCGQQWRGVKP